jgi:hypothetical protein
MITCWRALTLRLARSSRSEPHPFKRGHPVRIGEKESDANYRKQQLAGFGQRPLEQRVLETLPSNHEAQYYSNSSVGGNPFHLHDDVLDITATAGSNPQGLPYNSGVITTQNSFSQLYGYFEMRADKARSLPSSSPRVLPSSYPSLPLCGLFPPGAPAFPTAALENCRACPAVFSFSFGAADCSREPRLDPERGRRRAVGRKDGRSQPNHCRIVTAAGLY